MFHSIERSDLALSFFYGVRFDLFAVAVLGLPALLLQGVGWAAKRDFRKAALAVFLLFQVPFLFFNVGDSEFIQFTGRRFALSSLAVITGDGVQTFWTTIFSYQKLLSIACLFVLAYGYFVRAIVWRQLGQSVVGELKNQQKPGHFVRSRKAQFGLGVLLFLGFVVASRGGLQPKPIGFANAQIFKRSILDQMTMNTSFSMLQTIKRKGIQRESYMSEKEMLSHVNGSTPGESLWGPQKSTSGPQNVVVIIIESLSLEFMGKIHGDAGYTPFLDELAQKSLFFPNAFANARRSIEGVSAVLGGIPMLMSEPFITSPYATNTFYGYGTLLQNHGYSSAFFHGGKNGTMYFDQFVRSAGIQRYFGENEYGDSRDHDGTWGIWDEPFLQRVVKEANATPEPFALSLFTLSSHNPFRIPKDHTGRYPKGTDEIHEVVGYTDASLRRFFEEASKQPWYERTLFVITADHTFKPHRPKYQNELGNYRVPILFFHPKISNWPAVDVSEPIQQIDLLPSILDFLGFTSTQENLLGRSVFRAGPRFVVLQSDDLSWIVTRDHLLTMEHGGQATLSQIEPYLIRPQEKKTSIKEDEKMLLKNEQVKKELTQKVQATRQYFINGLWDNHLYYERPVTLQKSDAGSLSHSH